MTAYVCTHYACPRDACTASLVFVPPPRLPDLFLGDDEYEDVDSYAGDVPAPRRRSTRPNRHTPHDHREST